VRYATITMSPFFICHFAHRVDCRTRVGLKGRSGRWRECEEVGDMERVRRRGRYGKSEEGSGS
jgi:hypothetical protein